MANYIESSPIWMLCFVCGYLVVGVYDAASYTKRCGASLSRPVTTLFTFIVAVLFVMPLWVFMYWFDVAIKHNERAANK